ncbi:unnamed protein product [Parnassius mnemosyne]|uniref:Uncharacterized protein n=1 Tax=Parnassius mnemosyne TaxID=213953 RepID=A0AAV1M2L4_9NEOP
MLRKGATNLIFKELCNDDPREYKAVMRMKPSQVEILLNFIGTKMPREDTHMRNAMPATVKLEITFDISGGQKLLHYQAITEEMRTKYKNYYCDERAVSWQENTMN